MNDKVLILSKEKRLFLILNQFFVKASIKLISVITPSTPPNLLEGSAKIGLV